MEQEETRRLAGYRDEAVVRRFDAPEALDVRFYEVRAKSVLNRVPNASRMPFRWTVNPYRGCTHACTYCLVGDTPILMGDGSMRPLADLQRGDEVYGTELCGSCRRFVRTTVLDHWETVKPAYRVTLADGTQLVASGDHRFLTDRGWKHVGGSEQGVERRPQLTLADELLGFGHGATARDRTGQAVGNGADLRVVTIEPLGVELPMFDITTGTGDFIANGVVSHNCFARPTHRYLDLDAGRDFEREIVVKVNAPEVLRVQLGRPSWGHEHVAMGTNTDPYQWVESKYRLMPGIWEALRDSGTPCSVLTKSPLVLRDLPLLLELKERGVPVSANFSVPTLDEKAWRATEPHTPHPRARLEAVAELNRSGIPSGILVAPLMPGINDSPEQVERILELAAEAGATSVGGIGLHLRGETREVFFDWLRSQRPELVDRYEELYARGAYLPQAERRRLGALLQPSTTEAFRSRLRGIERPPDPAPPLTGSAPAAGTGREEVRQQTLF